MGALKRLFGRDRGALRPLYDAVVAEARRPDWYRAAGVPDTIDGRFDMVALVLSLVLLCLERDGESGKLPSVLLTELFVDDMDGTMREIGFGDLVVGKRIGGLMGALGGRLGAYREGDRRAALVRNLFRGVEPTPAALDTAEAMAAAFEARLAGLSLEAVVAGGIA